MKMNKSLKFKYLIWIITIMSCVIICIQSLNAANNDEIKLVDLKDAIITLKLCTGESTFMPTLKQLKGGK